MCHWVCGLFHYFDVQLSSWTILIFKKNIACFFKNIIYYIYGQILPKNCLLQNLKKIITDVFMIFYAAYVYGVSVNSLILLIFRIDFKTLSQKSTNRLNGSERKMKRKNKNCTRFRWKNTPGNLWAINIVEKIKNDASSVYIFVEIDTYKFIRCTMVKPGSPT